MSTWKTNYPRNTGQNRHLNELADSEGTAGSVSITGTTLTVPGVQSTLSFVFPDGFNEWNLRLAWQDTADNGASWVWQGGTRFLAGVIAAPASGANGFQIWDNVGSTMTADPLPDDTAGQALTVSFTQNVDPATVSYVMRYLNSNGRTN